MCVGDDIETFLFWSHVTEAVGCGPRLIVDGVPRLNPTAERISSGEVLAPQQPFAARWALPATAKSYS